jgi:hypothetical protein
MDWFLFYPKENHMNKANKWQDRNLQQDQENENKKSNTIKDPNDWTTGDEPMTGAQQSYLKTLSDEAGEDMDTRLTKADASKRIDELQHKTGRGLEQKGSAETESQRNNRNEDEEIRGGMSSH